MAIGMTYDEFWNQDPSLAIVYRDAYEVKRRMKEEEMYQQGLYIYHALCAVAPSFAFKPQQPLPYLERPFPTTAKEAKEREERDRIEQFFRMRERIIRDIRKRGDS
jgi:hypothetical protein